MTDIKRYKAKKIDETDGLYLVEIDSNEESVMMLCESDVAPIISERDGLRIERTGYRNRYIDAMRERDSELAIAEKAESGLNEFEKWRQPNDRH